MPISQSGRQAQMVERQERETKEFEDWYRNHDEQGRNLVIKSCFAGLHAAISAMRNTPERDECLTHMSKIRSLVAKLEQESK